MLGISPEYLLAMAATMAVSLTMHELAHARTALAFGDPTARDLGRVSLNPLVHLDPVGTITFLLAGFGWAKPVPVNPANLQPQRLGSAMVALAGPMANVGLAIVSGLLLRLWVRCGVPVDSPLAQWGWRLLSLMLTCNLCLAMFNLIPLFPLDGHHLQREVLPTESRIRYMRWQVRYGQYVLLAIIFVPRLLNVVLEQPNMFSPLSWLYRQVGAPIERWLVGY